MIPGNKSRLRARRARRENHRRHWEQVVLRQAQGVAAAEVAAAPEPEQEMQQAPEQWMDSISSMTLPPLPSVLADADKQV